LQGYGTEEINDEQIPHAITIQSTRGEKMEHNYRVKTLNENKMKAVAKKCRNLRPGNLSDYAAYEVIAPKKKDDNDAMVGTIMLWKNEDNSYSIGFFFSYYLGYSFYERVTTIPNEDDITITDVMKKLYDKYCTEENIKSVISTKEAKDEEETDSKEVSIDVL
jgi:predicted DNA-binding ribbon-helix-helix protein